MDDVRFGAGIRATRLRRRWRQRDVAIAAGVSDSTVSRIERGRIESLQLRAIRAVAAVLEVRVELLPRSRGADLDRLINASHTALAEQVIAWIGTLAAWVVRPEVSFSRYGERGVIDLLAWHAASRSLLVIELKTAIVDVGELLATFDRKLRNAWEVARAMGWELAAVAGLLIISESDANRRRIASHRATFGAAFPGRVVSVRRWLRTPTGDIRGMIFFANRHPRQGNVRLTATRRVRRAAAAPVARPPRSAAG